MLFLLSSVRMNFSEIFSRYTGYKKSLYCKNCFAKHEPDYIIEQNSHCHHRIDMTCKNCHEHWILCMLHGKRFLSKKISTANAHFEENSHFDNEKVTSDSETIDYNTKIDAIDISSKKDTKSFLNENDQTPNEQHNSKKRLFNVDESYLLKDSKMSLKSQRYFYDEMNCVGSGEQGIVMKAFDECNDSENIASQEEAEFHMQTAKFIQNLDSSMKQQFCNIMYKINHHRSIFQNTRVVDNIQDLERIYTRKSTSIMQNLPCPDPFVLHNHAVVSIESVLDHFLAYKVPFEYMLTSDEKVISLTKHCQTPKSFEIRQSVAKSSRSTESPLILLASYWSDDFEINQTKKTQRSTWLMTMTFDAPNNDNTSPKYTYTIALGRKGDNHDIVRNFFCEEMNTLAHIKERYVAFYGRKVPVVLKTLVIIADRPERCNLNAILHHGGTATKRWLYSAYINSKTLPSCKKCLQFRLNEIQKRKAFQNCERRCNICGNWNYATKNKAMQSTLPMNYPCNKQHKSSPKPPNGREVKNISFLYPIMQSYSWLIQGTKFAFHNLYHECWSVAEYKAYMKSLGISTDYIENIKSQVEMLRQSNPNDPNCSEYIKYPSMWTSSIDLDQNIDTPMHQIFLGLIKSIIQWTIDWLKSHQKLTQFGDHISPLIENIRLMQCGFCKIDRFGQKRNYTIANWVSEAYLAFARLMPILLGSVTQVFSSENKTMMTLYICLIESCYSLLCRLMTSTDIPVEEIDNHIKIFLSIWNEIEKNIYETHNEKSLTWFKKGNIISLLNYPRQIKKFGHIRLYWEGNRERYIQCVKPLLTNMRHSETYLITKVKEIYSKNTLKFFMKGDTSPTKEYDRYRMYKIYSQIKIVLESVKNNEPFLGFCYSKNQNCHGTKQHQFGIVIKNRNNSHDIHSIVFRDDIGTHICGLWSAPVDICKNKCFNIATKEELEKSVHCYCIFVPNIAQRNGSKSSNNFMYSVICDNWCIRSQYGDCNIYDLPSSFYSNMLSYINSL